MDRTGVGIGVGGLAAFALGFGANFWAVAETVAAQEAGELFRDCEACPQMVVVPAGSFTMGSPGTEDGRYDDEEPQHRVTVDYEFAVGVYEVTFDEWDTCALTGGCRGHLPPDSGWGRGERPVIRVSWEDAQAYVEMAFPDDGRTVPAPDGSGMGVRGARWDSDRVVLGGS